MAGRFQSGGGDPFALNPNFENVDTPLRLKIVDAGEFSHHPAHENAPAIPFSLALNAAPDLRA